MTNHIKYEIKNFAYTATMTIDKNDEIGTRLIAAETTAKYFIQSAVLVPHGEFLGWQVVLDRESCTSVSVFTSAGVELTEDDLNWIFDGCASVATFDDTKGSIEPDGCVYTLSWIEGKPHDLYDELSNSSNYSYDDYNSHDFKALFNMLAAEKASISMIAGSFDTDAKGHGAIIMTLPARMSLKLKTMIAGSLPHVAVSEVCPEENGDRSYDCLPDKCFASTMKDVLKELLNRNITKGTDNHLHEESGQNVDIVTDELLQAQLDHTPIDELGLSVRSYNCLKRYGIHSISDLKSLNDFELIRIRNLGPKNLCEIKEKLKMYKPGISEIKDNEDTEKPFTYMEQLDRLIGLDEVKKQVRRIAAFSRMKQALVSAGKDSQSVVLNMEFVGNPGTAKTTVARILAGVFYENGLLESPDVVEAGRADLVAKYTGQTAIKVKELFANAEGRLLFIDEAYSLVDGVRGEFGDEAISSIVQEMENNREKTIVILAGYPDKMKEFFDVNPGLRSRVPFCVSFADYSAEELLKIAELEAAKKGFNLSDEASDKVLDICRQVSGNADAGNGRFCRNLVDQAVLEYAVRVYGFEGEPGESNFELIPDDFSSQAVPVKSKRTVTMGFRAC